jgi:hypothetical protein
MKFIRNVVASYAFHTLYIKKEATFLILQLV